MFNTVTEITNILFKDWDTHSWRDVLIAAVVICVITMGFEGLKALKSYVIIRRRKIPLASEEENESPGSGIEITSMSVELITSTSSRVQRIRRQKIMLFSIEMMIHMVNFFFGYVLMFLVMTYNVWFLLSILLGSGAGFFIFHPVSEHMTSKYSLKTKSADHFSKNADHDGSFSINASENNEGLIL